jgi:serine/threonine protein kinase
MLLALEFLHRSNNGMCHLDIKPENIFIKKDPDVFKLGDFGLVAKLDFHRDVEEGDSRYMSMELLSGDHQDLTKSDIFSLGATLYEISVGRPLPMNGDEWQAIRAGSLQPLPDTPFEMEMIIRECMNPTYSNRPSAAELLKRPQLLSKEQKLLMSERNKVFQAKLALAQQAQNFKGGPPPPSAGGLVRRNTWSGATF